MCFYFIIDITSQTTKKICYLHEKKISHQNLNFKNILVNNIEKKNKKIKFNKLW